MTGVITVDRFQFESVNVRGHFIRHRNFLGELTPQDQPADDFSFTLVRRGEQGLVALRSVNFPDRCLRHRDFHLFVEPQDSPNPAADATFHRSLAPVLIDEG